MKESGGLSTGKRALVMTEVGEAEDKERRHRSLLKDHRVRWAQRQTLKSRVKRDLTQRFHPTGLKDDG